MDASRFSTHSLKSNAWGEAVQRILAAAVQAVDPANAVAQTMQRQGNCLTIAGQEYDLTQFGRVRVIGAGKAGAPMAQAAARILGERLSDGLVITKQGYSDDPQKAAPIVLLEAGHPVPDERSVRGAQRLIELLQDSRPDDLVLCLISGGGSALMVAPVPGLNLSDLQRLTSILLACGANIYEINTLRKHLDQVKGGGLARLVFPARLVTLALSDVVGDPLDVIASGPTVPDPSTFQDAREVLERYSIQDKAPAEVIAHIQKGLHGEISETPKPGDGLFASVQNVIVGSNLQAAQAALKQAAQEGFHPLLLTTYLQGEARQVGRALATIARQVIATGQPAPRPACIIAGGETTVTVRGDGLGGRNMELALASVLELSGLPAVLISLATDGGDGPTDAAGAIVTGQTLAQARLAGLDPQDYLTRNDSYHFFAALEDLLRPGPTQTNVNDLTFLFIL